MAWEAFRPWGRGTHGRIRMDVRKFILVSYWGKEERNEERKEEKNEEKKHNGNSVILGGGLFTSLKNHIEPALSLVENVLWALIQVSVKPSDAKHCRS